MATDGYNIFNKPGSTSSSSSSNQQPQQQPPRVQEKPPYQRTSFGKVSNSSLTSVMPPPSLPPRLPKPLTGDERLLIAMNAWKTNNVELIKKALPRATVMEKEAFYEAMEKEEEELRPTRPRRTHYIREEDAKEMEERFLKWITPPGKDPWLHNQHLLPLWQGMRGDRDYDFAKAKDIRVGSPERVVVDFLNRMTYPKEAGHFTQLTQQPLISRATHAWSNEAVFGMPPVAVVVLERSLVEGTTTCVLRVAEVHWSRRKLRLIDVVLRNLQDEEGMEYVNPPEEPDDEVKAANDDVDIDDENLYVTKTIGEYDIPSRWLLLMKNYKWPKPPSREELSVYYADDIRKNPETGQQFTGEDLADDDDDYWRRKRNEDKDNKNKNKTVELLPYSTTPFPQAQAATLGRQYWIFPEDYEEDDEGELTEYNDDLRAEYDDDPVGFEGATYDNPQFDAHEPDDELAVYPAPRPWDKAPERRHRSS